MSMKWQFVLSRQVYNRTSHVCQHSNTVAASYIEVSYHFIFLKMVAEFVKTVYVCVLPNVTFLAIGRGERYLGTRFFTSIMQLFS